MRATGRDPIVVGASTGVKRPRTTDTVAKPAARTSDAARTLLFARQRGRRSRTSAVAERGPGNATCLPASIVPRIAVHASAGGGAGTRNAVAEAARLPTRERNRPHSAQA